MTGGATRGSCFGFEVASDLTFRYLRSAGGGSGALAVDVHDGTERSSRASLALEWRSRADGFHAQLWRDGRRFELSTSDFGPYFVDPEDARVAVPASGNDVKREERLWGVPAALCMLARGDHPLHAAAAEIDGGAIILAAPGTFGKTTMAAGLARAGMRVLTEDLCCVRLAGTATVVPGPAMLRIRPDVAAQLAVPHAEVLEAGDARVHLALDTRSRGDSSPVPLRGLLLLRNRTGPPAIERVAAGDAIRDLFALAFRLRGSDAAERCFQQTADMAARVPMWNFYYRRRLEDLDHAVEKVLAQV